MFRSCRTSAAAALILLAFLTGCATPPPEFESSVPLSERWSGALDGRTLGGWGPIPYPMPSMDGVTVHRMQLDHGTTTDIYRPSEEIAKTPVIIMPRVYTRKHDYNWLGVSLLDIDYQISWCRLLAGEGYTVAVMESDSPFKGFISIVDFLRENARSLDLDTDSIGFWAMSSNPDAVMMYLARPDLDKKGLTAGAFLYPTMEGAPFAKMEHISYFIATGGRDDPALNAKADKFAVQAAEAGLDIVTMHHPAGEHGFDSLQDDETTRNIIDGVLEFYRSRLK